MKSARPRAISQLSKTVHNQLNLYALAATAAGAGVLAQPAQARIIYTPAHRVINNGQHYDLDLNHDGQTDFVLTNSVRCNTDQCFYDLTETAHANNLAVGHTRGSFAPYASALNAGSHIGRNRQFVGGIAILGYVYQGGGGTSIHGPWANVTNGYLGFEFRIKGKAHFGWARMNVKISGTTVSAKLTGYAYETVPNKPIIAGKTKDGNEMPVTLGQLARGAVHEESPAQ